MCEPIPEPEVPARLAADHEVLHGARVVMRLALKHGWKVVPTYARGPLIGAAGKVMRTVESIALRMWRGDERAIGLWLRHPTTGSYAFASGYAWAGGGRVSRVDSAGLRAALKADAALGT